MMHCYRADAFSFLVSFSASCFWLETIKPLIAFPNFWVMYFLVYDKMLMDSFADFWIFPVLRWFLWPFLYVIFCTGNMLQINLLVCNW